jgi:hypothetical protein
MISKFVSLSSYCILEYRMTPLGDTNPSLLTSDYYVVDNKNVNAFQIYNTDGYAATTHNSRDLSVVSVGGSKAVYNDITLIPIYTDYDQNITVTQLDSSYSTNQVVDKVRVHLASGFDFTEVENLIIGVKQTMNDLRQLVLANVLLDAQTAQTIFSYNPQPLFIANTIYDKYVDITVPAIAWMDQDFTDFGASSFEYQVTGGIGLVKNAPIMVFLAEATYEEYNADNNVTYDRYQIVNYYEGSIAQNNIFDALGCVIEEATDGDYIRFFATWNGAFPDSLIATLNNSGANQDWIFSHQLQVYEQVGSSLVPSGNLIVYQEDKFDVPLTYRPILKEAGFAVSMSIDYTLSLINKLTGEQVIRTGALSVINPNKYGKQLAKIVLPEGPQSMRVYNKIVQKNYETGSIFAPKSSQVLATTSGTSGTSSVRVIEKKVREYLPIKQASIRVSQKNALHKQGNESDQVIYGQGRMTLPIDQTDNVIKFTVYETDPRDRNKQSRLDLNNGSDFNLVFGSTTDFVFATLIDDKLTNPSRGEIAFRIPKEKAISLLKTTDQQFSITVVSKADGTETLLYTGTWTSSLNYSTVTTAEEDALTALANETTIAELQKKITELTNQNQTLTEKINANAGKTVKAETPANTNAAAATPARSSQTTS